MTTVAEEIASEHSCDPEALQEAADDCAVRVEFGPEYTQVFVFSDRSSIVVWSDGTWEVE